MRISDWSSDVCSSDLASLLAAPAALVAAILVWNAVAGGFAKLLDYLFVLAAIVALCVAVWPLAGPLRAARGARPTVYAITDRRLFILELYPRRRLRSFAPAELEAPRVQDRGKGRGDVIFGWAVAMEQTRQGLRNRLREATFVGGPRSEEHTSELETLMRIT